MECAQGLDCTDEGLDERMVYWFEQREQLKIGDRANIWNKSKN